jgi:uncharacterized protein YjgD (DUF1641 family)
MSAHAMVTRSQSREAREMMMFQTGADLAAEMSENKKRIPIVMKALHDIEQQKGRDKALMVIDLYKMLTKPDWQAWIGNTNERFKNVVKEKAWDMKVLFAIHFPTDYPEFILVASPFLQ